VYNAQLEHSLEETQKMTGDELKYGSASVEGLMTGRCERAALNND